MTEPSVFRRFNLDTLSGIFPGTKSRTWQRIQVVATDSVQEPAEIVALLFWADGDTCVLLREDEGPQEAEWMRWSPVAPGRLPNLLIPDLGSRGYRPQICATCGFWQGPGEGDSHGLPFGSCIQMASAASPAPAEAIAVDWWRQSALSPACHYWQEKDGAAATTRISARPHPAPGIGERSSSTGRRWLDRLLGRGSATGQRPYPWQEGAGERSGVGAGTDACLVCQERIANLGAITVATRDRDRRTYSVWRCRGCRTYYLNDWTDRWERLESLETEERFYRLAPLEAVTLLQEMYGPAQGSPAAGSSGPGAQVEVFVRGLAGRRSLTHQIRHGR